VATREGTVLACELGVLFGRLGMLSSQICSSLALSLKFVSFLFFHFILSSFFFSSALFSCCRFPVGLLFLSSFLLWGLLLCSLLFSYIVWSDLSLSYRYHCCVSFFIFLFFIFLFFYFLFFKNEEPNKKTPPTPLQWDPLALSARIASSLTRCTPKRSHQRKHLDCLHGFEFKSFVSVESAFLINYYKSISGFIRKRVFSRRGSFPYDFRRILSLASSGFPLKWGVNNTSKITFFLQKWNCLQDENN
jgi:hypothetical protein